MKKAMQRLLLFTLSITVCTLLASCQSNTTIRADTGINGLGTTSAPTSNNTINMPSMPSGMDTDDSYLSIAPTSIQSRDDGVRVYEYDGNEISFEASVLAEGVFYNNLGFMLYLNGSAIPFVMEGIDNNEAAYFHILRDVSGQSDLLYHYSCIPYGGVAGEEAVISVLCFAQPEYVYDPGTGQVPDPIYHVVHYITTYGFIVQFNESAPRIEERPELETVSLISNVTISEDSEQEEFIEELNATYYEDVSPKMTLDKCLEQGVQHVVYYDGVYDVSNQVCIDGKDTVHVKYRVLGAPDAKITLAFALGKAYIPVLINGADSYSFTCEEGKVYTVEADINVSDIAEATNLRCNIFLDNLINIYSGNTVFYFTAK